MQKVLDKLTELVDSLAGGALHFVLPAAIVIIVLWIVWKVWRRRPHAAVALGKDLAIDLATLPDEAPPDWPPILEFYNMPVRLAAIILAPAGRISELPSDFELPRLIDSIVPGLAKVSASHRPAVHRWPNQVSARGFAHLVFNQVRLPGEGGKGTPWSTVAGMFKVKNQPVMAALILRAADDNNFGQTIIEAEHQWLGCLRVRLS